MSNKTEHLELSVYDFNTDFASAFVNGVAGISDSNMHKIDSAFKDLLDRVIQLESKLKNINQ